MDTKFDVPTIERFLRLRGWKRAAFEKNGEWRVEIDDDVLTILRFSDSDVQVQDVGAVATPRWVPVTECFTLEELRAELVSVGTNEWECSYCGEEGGEPRTCSWREFQGVEGHGGVVTFEEEMCSKCYKPQRNLLGVPR